MSKQMMNSNSKIFYLLISDLINVLQKSSLRKLQATREDKLKNSA
jgi:hypothetical protein